MEVTTNWKGQQKMKNTERQTDPPRIIFNQNTKPL